MTPEGACDSYCVNEEQILFDSRLPDLVLHLVGFRKPMIEMWMMRAALRRH